MVTKPRLGMTAECTEHYMQQSDELRYYLGILRRRYPYFVAAFIAVFAISAIVAVIIPPIYRSEAKILVESQQIPADLVRSTVTGLADERIAVTRQRITARDVLLGIVDKYELFPKERIDMTPSELVNVMRERILILPFDLALAGRRAREGALTVAFTVGFEYERPEIAAKVANELVTLILNEDIRSRTSKASETTQFLSREFDRLQQELAKIDTVLSEFKQKNRDALPERIPFQMSALERTEGNLKNYDRQIGELSESKRLLTLEMEVRRAARSGEGKNGGEADPFRRLDMLRSDLAQKSVLFSNSHPEIKALRSQIVALEKDIKARLANKPDPSVLSDEEKDRLDFNTRIVAEKIETIDRQIKLYTAQREATVKAIAALTSVLSQAPEVQINLALMERQRASYQKSLDDISGKLAEARLGEQLEKDQQAERFEIIEQPITPQDPVRPDRLKILAIGFGLSGLVGAGAVVGLEMLNQSIRVSNDIVKSLNKHPMVVIPYIHTQQEGRRKIGRLLAAAIVGLIAIVLSLATLHFMYMPIDLLFFKVLERLSL